MRNYQVRVTRDIGEYEDFVPAGRLCTNYGVLPLGQLFTLEEATSFVNDRIELDHYPRDLYAIEEVG